MGNIIGVESFSSCVAPALIESTLSCEWPKPIACPNSCFIALIKVSVLISGSDMLFVPFTNLPFKRATDSVSSGGSPVV